MAEYELSRRARQDLFDIFVYGLEKFGERQAQNYAAKLDYVFRLLADHPEMGRKAEGIASGVRRHEHGAHIILYEKGVSGIRILALVHKRSVINIDF